MKGQVVDKGKFFDLIGYKPHPKQIEFHRSNARFKVAACGRRAGKRLHVDTLIGTPELGFKRMGDIEIGDKVFDDQGRICNVIGVSDVQWEQAYKITFDDGSILYAHDEHEWLTYDKKARRTRNLSEAKHKSDRRRKIVPPKVRTTKQIMDTINYGVEPNHAIELCGPVDYPKKDLIIDPYVLGVWLSDGSKSNGQFSCPDSDNWIVEKIRERGFEVRRSQSGDKCPVWNIIGLIPKLRELGVLKNKHVPRQYLFGSIEQRQDLLHGLMDTDGTAGKGQSCFDNTNKNLADSVEYLICSLGGRVNRSGRVGKLYGVEKKYCYRVWSSNIIDLFSLPRKLKSQKSNPARKNYYRFIKSIEATVMMPMKCIAVDSPSHLYLAGTAFIPTHNTYMTAKDIEPLLMVPNKRVWLVAPTYKLGEKEFRVIWEDMILKLEFGKHPEIKKAYSLSQGNMFITFPWNTTIEVHSAERPDTLVGDGLDLVVMCEAAKHQRVTWERMIEPALADKRGSAIFTSTPEGKNFFYELWQRGLDDFEPEFDSWQYPTWENSVIFPGGYNDPEIQRLKRNMSPEAFDQEICADFTSFTGKIYKEFIEIVHVKNHVYNPDWPNYIAWDFGYNAPTAAVEFQVSPRDTIHVWREHYKAGMIMDEHFEEMRNREQPPGYKVDLMFGDSADPQAIEEICVKFGPCVGDPRAKENWRDGINEVKKFLKVRPDGDPGLFVDPSCKNGIREFNNYKAVEGGKDRDPREQAKKSEDHFMDALRYGVMHIFRLGMRDRLSDAMTTDTMRTGLSDAGFVTQSQNDAYPTLAASGFVTLEGQRF